MLDRFVGKLTEKHYKRKDLALIWGVNVMTVSNKMTGKTPITCQEFITAAKYYGITDAEILYIFFGESRLRDPLA